MTEKESILCYLALGNESEIHIQGYFEDDEKEIAIEKIRELISELIREGLVCITGEREYILSSKKTRTITEYGLTLKGQEKRPTI